MFVLCTLYSFDLGKIDKEFSFNVEYFRMVGGVLVERTVKEVVPALVNNR